MASKRKRKSPKKLTIKELDTKAHELIEIINRNGVFVPDAPTMNDVNADDRNFHNSKQRKGRGTGNTKQNKKQMKKNQRLLLELWIKTLQSVVDELEPLDDNDEEHMEIENIDAFLKDTERIIQQ